jgi:hypothetical protein
MKMKIQALFPAIAVLIAGAASAGADTSSYSWNGSANVLPGIYVGGDINYPAAGGAYAMASGRLNVASPGNNGWINNAFDWDAPLSDSQSVTGALTFRINSFNNGPGDNLGRVRLLFFNAPFANGLSAFVGLYGSDKRTTRDGAGGWKSGGHSEWNRWEYNPDTAGDLAPTGTTFVYNSFNMNDPATDPDFFRAITNGTDHILSWSAKYVADCDVVQVTTALDGVPWTTIYVNRGFNNINGTFNENALAKQHGSMQGPWNAQFTQVNWATFEVPVVGFNTKNYAWDSLGGCIPPLYNGGDFNYPNAGGSYSNSWSLGRLHVTSPGNNGWINNAFDWNGPLADNEQVSGSLKFRINNFNNGPGDNLGRVRLLWVGVPYANGLQAFVGLYGSDKKTSRSSGWGPGGHSEWNKWEYNPDTAGTPAPAGQTYVYNSFNMNDPATDPNFFLALTNGTDHVLSWNARYVADCDVVQVTTALDGVPWTTMYVNRGFNNINGTFNENALAKQHGSMQGPWDAEFLRLNWATTTLPVPVFDTKNYSWDSLGGCIPPLYNGGDINYPNAGGSYSNSWSLGRLHVTSPGNNGWINNAFDWNGPLADTEKVSGSLKFRINSFNNGPGDNLGRVRLLWVGVPFANGLQAFVGLYGSDKKTSRSSGWGPGGHPEWNKWEFNPDTAGARAPTGQTYVYNSFNMNEPVTDPNFFVALTNGTDHVLSWTAQYMACDTVRVTTVLDGVPWTTTDVNRSFNNINGTFMENALAKQHGSMQGAWDAEFMRLDWATTTAAPSVCITRLGSGQVEVKWPFGTLLAAPNVTGPWTPMPAATSPYLITPSAARMFYRAQTP